MSARRLLLGLGVMLLGACQSTQLQSRRDAGVDFDAQPLWQAFWSEDEQRVADLLEAAAWPQLASVEAERYRQSDRVMRGERGEVIAEVEQWLAAAPFDPDLLYLRARLHQDSARLAQRFAQLAESFPQHAWIQLGAAGSALEVGELDLARQALDRAPDWPAAREFRALIAARLAHAEGQSQPWQGLIEDALYRGYPAALAELRALARDHGEDRLLRVADAESALRRAFRTASIPIGSATEAEALHLLLQRMHAELGWKPDTSPAELLIRMDGWAEALGLEAHWGVTPAYRLPFEAGLLFRPELDASPLAKQLARHRLALLLGWSWLHGSQAMQLDGVDRVTLDWPGQDRGIEIWLADRVQGEGPWVSGGAVFRGFFVRRDLVIEAARRYQRQTSRVSLESASRKIAAQGPAFQLQPEALGSIPEDADLPLRLRRMQLAEQPDEALEKEWRCLLLHEAGHLPDVLPWTNPRSRPIAESLGMGLRSVLRDGWLLSEWEYRAQLRALASGIEFPWQFAHTLEVARDRHHPYHKPYRRLIQRLIGLAREQRPELPALANWHLLPPQQILHWTRQLAARDGIELLPEASVQELLAKTGPLKLPEQETGGV